MRLAVTKIKLVGLMFSNGSLDPDYIDVKIKIDRIAGSLKIFQKRKLAKDLDIGQFVKNEVYGVQAMEFDKIQAGKASLFWRDEDYK